MPGTLTHVGRQMTAKPWAGQSFPDDQGYEMRLVTDDFTLAASLTPDDLSYATFSGSSPIGFLLSDGAPAVVMDGGDATVLLRDEPFVWDCTASPQTVYGWALYSADLEELLAVEKYSTPHVLEVGSRHTLYASIRIGACG